MKTITVFALLSCLVACSSVPKEKDKTSESTTPAPGSGSSDDTPTGETPVTGTPVTDGGTPTSDSGPKAPANQAECITACEKQHPVATAKNKTLDATCFLGGVCESVCNDLKSGTLVQPTKVDGGVTCDTVTPDSYPITTTSQACSDCLDTTATCCTQWISIFSSTDGRALNTCTNTCFSTFKN